MDIVQRERLSGYAAGRGNCAPLVGVMMISGATGRNCREFNDETARIATEKNIGTVLLAANGLLTRRARTKKQFSDLKMEYHLLGPRGEILRPSDS